MNVCHFTICYQTNHGIFRNEVNWLLKRIFKFNQFVRRNGCVNYKHENRSCILLVCERFVWDNVFQGCVTFHKFIWQCCLTNVACVVCWEVVDSSTYTTWPCFLSKINWTVWIKNAFTLLAFNWRIIDRFQVNNFFHWCINTTNRLSNSGSSYSSVWPIVPWESKTILVFSLSEVH